MSTDISALVGSRICHDLISPIGAISNGVEMIAMTGSQDGAEMALINDSVANASARIRFFRVAYGGASMDQMMGAREVRQILDTYCANSRLTCDWQIDADQRRCDVRSSLLLIQCFESALPRDGHIVISRNDAGWTLSATAPQLRWQDDLWDSVTNSFAKPAFTPADVQFALLPDALAEAGLTLTIDRHAAGVTATLN